MPTVAPPAVSVVCLHTHQSLSYNLLHISFASNPSLFIDQGLGQINNDFISLNGALPIFLGFPKAAYSDIPIVGSRLYKILRWPSCAWDHVCCAGKVWKAAGVVVTSFPLFLFCFILCAALTTLRVLWEACAPFLWR